MCVFLFLYSAAEKHARRLMRDRRIIAYFKQCIKGKEVDTTKELSQELASLVPYEVPISSLTITHLHCQVKINNYRQKLKKFLNMYGLMMPNDEFLSLFSSLARFQVQKCFIV